MLSALLILQAGEKKGQTRDGVRTRREGICTPSSPRELLRFRLLRTRCVLKRFRIDIPVMGENETGTEPLSELNLGIRELFRVVVPGAYAVLLLEWLGSEKIRGWLGESHS